MPSYYKKIDVEEQMLFDSEIARDIKSKNETKENTNVNNKNLISKGPDPEPWG
ncbi:hypothetical protein CSC2_17480 [Clostridium zeae]|uniref:Uncharacterized protein n=1 Tax=Clostridium zeae TaxID=2759022 RepID=A0ABQ1E8V3_9CLOT|nr:hypothetical protein [Clostridium zeae]GFZ31222.1 hypothetical protein CSC2_17480 [Clostridium zeae]